MRDAAALYLRTIVARAYPRIIGLYREPMWILQETLMPVLSVSAFALVYQAMGAHDLIGFAILGGAMTAFWLNVLWSMGAQFYWERDSGNLELYIIAPTSLMAILAGMALGGMVMTLLRAAVIVVIGSLIFGVRFELSNWPAILAVFLLLMLALYSLGMVFSSLFLLWGRPAWHIVNLLQEPVYLLSGLNFPLKTLLNLGGSTLAAVGPFLLGLLPLTAGIDALRQLLFPESANGLLPVALEVALLAALSVLFFILAWFCLRYLERRAREEGRLTVKWQ